MADAEEAKTLTAEDTAEGSDKSTKAEDSTKADAPDDSASSAAKDDTKDEGDKGSEETTTEQPDDSEGEGETPTKTDNRAGYRLRQLTDNNPALSRIKDTLQPWVDEATDPREQKDRARDVNDYIRDAGRTQDDLIRDNEQVVREIPIFNPNSPEFRQDLLTRAQAQFARDMAIPDQNGVLDQNGNPMIVGTRMRLLDYMREKAEDYGFGVEKAKSDKQPAKTKAKSKAKMDAAADSPGGSSPTGAEAKASEEDPFLAGFDNPYGRHNPTGAHEFSER